MVINKAEGTLTLTGDGSVQYYTDPELRRAFLTRARELSTELKGVTLAIFGPGESHIRYVAADDDPEDFDAEGL